MGVKEDLQMIIFPLWEQTEIASHNLVIKKWSHLTKTAEA